RDANEAMTLAGGAMTGGGSRLPACCGKPNEPRLRVYSARARSENAPLSPRRRASEATHDGRPDLQAQRLPSDYQCRSGLSSMPLESRAMASTVPVTELRRKRMLFCPLSSAALTTALSSPGTVTRVPAVR